MRVSKKTIHCCLYLLISFLPTWSTNAQKKMHISIFLKPKGKYLKETPHSITQPKISITWLVLPFPNEGRSKEHRSIAPTHVNELIPKKAATNTTERKTEQNIHHNKNNDLNAFKWHKNKNEGGGCAAAIHPDKKTRGMVTTHQHNFIYKRTRRSSPLTERERLSHGRARMSARKSRNARRK